MIIINMLCLFEQTYKQVACYCYLKLLNLIDKRAYKNINMKFNYFLV